jgi:hypothetical protein
VVAAFMTMPAITPRILASLLTLGGSALILFLVTAQQPRS